MPFGRHRREFARAWARGEFERTPAGIVFPRQGALLHGVVTVTSKYGVGRYPNRLCQGFVDVAGGLLAPGGTAATLGTLYMSLWGNDVVPDVAYEAAHTLSEFVYCKNLGELGDAPEGYDETTRAPWVYADVGGNLLDNSASPAAFTLRTVSSILVYGFALHAASDSTFGPDAKRLGRPYYGISDVGGGEVNFASVDVTANTNESVLSEFDDPVGGRIRTTDLFTNPIDGNDLGSWADPSDDDYYDSDLGHWVDPSGDDVTPSFPAQSIIAISRPSEAPFTFADMDPLTITWGIQLS